MAREPLPVDEVLPEIVRHLRAGPNLVLVAPPGAGKTTRVPGAILDAGLLRPRERVVILEPRRLAARLAAKRIAAERGARLGEEVGYQVRFEDRTSARTRIAFLTEGILTRRIHSDPTLEGVGAVILDEFHERSIHADLALAFLREIQATVRPELRLLVMSATLEAEPVAAFLGGAPIVTSSGRLHPVKVEWLERPDERPLVERVVSGVRQVLRADERAGHVLAFLPGAGEIRRAAEALEPKVEGQARVLPLYGELPAEAQDRAVEPSRERKVILATNIAESSLTIEGVTAVVDSGYAKLLRQDPVLGVDRLELARVSLASAAQRAGRAGRTGPGQALRLWTEKEERLFAAREEAEIQRVDLAPAVLDVLRWTPGDPRAFGWFEAPAEGRVSRALALLLLLGLIEGDPPRTTTRGARLGELPVHPRLARMLESAAERGVLEEGALLAALAAEREVMRRREVLADEVGSSDLLARMERVERLSRARFARDEAERLGLDAQAARAAVEAAARLFELGKRAFPGRSEERDPAQREEALLRAVLAGHPERVARRRKEDGALALAEGGRARLARESVVKEGELLVAVELELSSRGTEGLVRSASRVEREWLARDTAGLEVRREVRFHAGRQSVECVEVQRYRSLILAERPVGDAAAEDVAACLCAAALADLEHAWPLDDAGQVFLQRLRFLTRAEPELLPDLAEDPRAGLLPELCRGRRSFAELRALSLKHELLARLPPQARRALEEHAPERLRVPSGREVELRYEPEGPPVLAVRLQEVFGWTAGPRVAGGRVPVKLELLAPNQRPVQVTQDLASFWASTYAEVRRELMRRYPKHQWPEDPRDGDPRKRPGRR